MVAFEVADDGLDGVAPFEQLFFQPADPFALTPVHDVHRWVVLINVPIAQIYELRRWSGCSVHHLDRGVLQLLRFSYFMRES